MTQKITNGLIYQEKKWLNKKLNPDKESENRDDIVFRIEIIHHIPNSDRLLF